MAILGIAVLSLFVPDPVTVKFHRDTEVEFGWISRVLAHPQLLRLDIGVLVLHFVMTATLFTLPLVWVKQHGFPLMHHWWVYLPILFFSVLVVLPFIILGEKKRQLKQVFIGAVFTLGLACLMLWAGISNWWMLVMALWIFFIGFNLLEASLPSLVAKYAPAAHKGTAMGAFSTAQFLGAFLGAMMAGWVSDHFGEAYVFLTNAGVVLLWLGMAVSMRQPPYLSSELLRVGDIDAKAASELVMKLTGIRGVAEAVVIPQDGIAYLKVDKKALDRAALLDYSIDD